MSRRLFGAVAIFLLVASGCGRCVFTPENEILARVNKDCITTGDLREKAVLYGVSISNRRQARELLNLLINDSLILEEAQRRGIRIASDEMKKEISNFAPGYDTPEMKKTFEQAGVKYGRWMQDIKKRVRRKYAIEAAMKERVRIDERELRDYFWTNITAFRRAHKVRAAQIVVKEEETAKELLMQITNGADFAELAKKHSITSEAERGGDLDFFSEKEMPAFISRVVFRMKPGEISGVVKSPYGWHIFKCIDVRQAETPKFEDVRGDVYERYYDDKKEEYFNLWIRELRAKAKITVKEENIDANFKEAKK